MLFSHFFFVFRLFILINHFQQARAEEQVVVAEATNQKTHMNASSVDFNNILFFQFIFAFWCALKRIRNSSITDEIGGWRRVDKTNQLMFVYEV